MNPIIELLQQSDVDAVAALFASDMRDLGRTPSIDALRTLTTRILDELDAPRPRSRCWVARLSPDSTPVGVILVNIHASVEFGGDGLWIEELYVDPTHRKGGLGRRLVEAALDWAEESGYRGIDLEAYHGNTPAGVLYRSLGFHRLGRERFYIRFDEEE